MIKLKNKNIMKTYKVKFIGNTIVTISAENEQDAKTKACKRYNVPLNTIVATKEVKQALFNEDEKV